VVLLSASKGGFPLRKKPLNCEASVYSNSEFGIPAQNQDADAYIIGISLGKYRLLVKEGGRMIEDLTLSKLVL
jgi:hypothetical protein